MKDDPMVNEQKPKVTTDELRGGSTPGVGRYVLVISTVGLIIAFAVLLILYR